MIWSGVSSVNSSALLHFALHAPEAAPWSSLALHSAICPATTGPHFRIDIFVHKQSDPRRGKADFAVQHVHILPTDVLDDASSPGISAIQPASVRGRCLLCRAPRQHEIFRKDLMFSESC
jgi:hypothetical protein